MSNEPRFALGPADLQLTLRLTLKLGNIGYGESMPPTVVVGTMAANSEMLAAARRCAGGGS